MTWFVESKTPCLRTAAVLQPWGSACEADWQIQSPLHENVRTSPWWFRAGGSSSRRLWHLSRSRVIFRWRTGRGRFWRSRRRGCRSRSCSSAIICYSQFLGKHIIALQLTLTLNGSTMPVTPSPELLVTHYQKRVHLFLQFVRAFGNSLASLPIKIESARQIQRDFVPSESPHVSLNFHHNCTAIIKGVFA